MKWSSLILLLSLSHGVGVFAATDIPDVLPDDVTTVSTSASRLVNRDNGHVSGKFDSDYGAEKERSSGHAVGIVDGKVKADETDDGDIR